MLVILEGNFCKVFFLACSVLHVACPVLTRKTQHVTRYRIFNVLSATTANSTHNM